MEIDECVACGRPSIGYWRYKNSQKQLKVLSICQKHYDEHKAHQNRYDCASDLIYSNPKYRKTLHAKKAGK